MKYTAWTKERKRKLKGGGYKIEHLACLEYVDPETGERKGYTRAAPNAQAARRLLSKLEEDLDERGPKSFDAERMTFSELVAHCKESRYVDAIYDADGRKIAGVRGKKTVVGHMKVLEKFFADTQLREINVASIRKYKIWRLKTKTKRGTLLCIGTVNRELSTMRAMLNEAIMNDLGRLRINPFQRAPKGELINLADERKRETIISFEEEELVLEELDTEYTRHTRVLLMGLLDTGARRGEMLRIRKSNDLHFGEGRFFVDGKPCEWCRRNPGDHLILRSWKGKKLLIRPAPVTPRLKAALLDLIENPGIATFKKGRKSKQAPDSDLVFGITTFQKSWENARAAVNLKHVRLHDLRHTAGTRLAEFLDLSEVGTILGHSDPRTTQRYVNRVPEVVRKAGEVMHELHVAHKEKTTGNVLTDENDTVN